MIRQPSSVEEIRVQPISLAQNREFAGSMQKLDIPYAMMHIEKSNSGTGFTSDTNQIRSAYEQVLRCLLNTNGMVQELLATNESTISGFQPIDVLLREIRPKCSAVYWRKNAIANSSLSASGRAILMLQPEEVGEEHLPSYTEVCDDVVQYGISQRIIHRCRAIIEMPVEDKKTLVSESIRRCIETFPGDAHLLSSALNELLEQYFPEKKTHMESDVSRLAQAA